MEKRIYVDQWTVTEKVCLLCSLYVYGEDWTSCCDFVKHKLQRGRPEDWFTPYSLKLQYDAMVEEYVDPRNQSDSILKQVHAGLGAWLRKTLPVRKEAPCLRTTLSLRKEAYVDYKTEDERLNKLQLLEDTMKQNLDQDLQSKCNIRANKDKQVRQYLFSLKKRNILKASYESGENIEEEIQPKPVRKLSHVSADIASTIISESNTPDVVHVARRRLGFKNNRKDQLELETRRRNYEMEEVKQFEEKYVKNLPAEINVEQEIGHDSSIMSVTDDEQNETNTSIENMDVSDIFEASTPTSTSAQARGNKSDIRSYLTIPSPITSYLNMSSLKISGSKERSRKFGSRARDNDVNVTQKVDIPEPGQVDEKDDFTNKNTDDKQVHMPQSKLGVIAEKLDDQLLNNSHITELSPEKDSSASVIRTGFGSPDKTVISRLVTPQNDTDIVLSDDMNFEEEKLILAQKQERMLWGDNDDTSMSTAEVLAILQDTGSPDEQNDTILETGVTCDEGFIAPNVDLLQQQQHVAESPEQTQPYCAASPIDARLKLHKGSGSLVLYDLIRERSASPVQKPKLMKSEPKLGVSAIPGTLAGPMETTPLTKHEQFSVVQSKLSDVACSPENAKTEADKKSLVSSPKPELAWQQSSSDVSVKSNIALQKEIKDREAIQSLDTAVSSVKSEPISEIAEISKGCSVEPEVIESDALKFDQAKVDVTPQSEPFGIYLEPKFMESESMIQPSLVTASAKPTILPDAQKKPTIADKTVPESEEILKVTEFGTQKETDTPVGFKTSEEHSVDYDHGYVVQSRSPSNLVGNEDQKAITCIPPRKSVIVSPKFGIFTDTKVSEVPPMVASEMAPGQGVDKNCTDIHQPPEESTDGLVADVKPPHTDRTVSDSVIVQKHITHNLDEEVRDLAGYTYATVTIKEGAGNPDYIDISDTSDIYLNFKKSLETDSADAPFTLSLDVGMLISERKKMRKERTKGTTDAAKVEVKNTVENASLEETPKTSGEIVRLEETTGSIMKQKTEVMHASANMNRSKKQLRQCLKGAPKRGEALSGTSYVPGSHVAKISRTGTNLIGVKKGRSVTIRARLGQTRRKQMLASKKLKKLSRKKDVVKKQVSKLQSTERTEEKISHESAENKVDTVKEKEPVTPAVELTSRKRKRSASEERNYKLLLHAYNIFADSRYSYIFRKTRDNKAFNFQDLSAIRKRVGNEIQDVRQLYEELCTLVANMKMTVSVDSYAYEMVQEVENDALPKLNLLIPSETRSPQSSPTKRPRRALRSSAGK